jgi:hypothetical protein
LLPRGANEPKNAGAYTYFLLPIDEAGVHRDRVLGVIERILRAVSPESELIAAGTRTSKINVYQFPVLTSAPDSAKTTAELARWVLDHYDYSRARTILQTLQRPSTTPPLLISSLEPLSQNTDVPITPLLAQRLDLDDDDTLLLWVDQFIAVSANRAEWNVAHFNEVVLSMREFANKLAASGKDVPSSIIAVLTFVRKAK